MFCEIFIPNSLTRCLTCTSTLCYFLCLYILEERTQHVSNNESLQNVASRPTGAVTSTQQNPNVKNSFSWEDTADGSAAAWSTRPDTTSQEDGTPVRSNPGGDMEHGASLSGKPAKQGDGMHHPEQGQEFL